MRIIHCADVHLDSALGAHLDAERKKERRAELTATFLRMVDYANENDIDAIIIAGDLFDTGNIRVAVRNAVMDAIVNHPGITFFYLRGNHDADGFLSAFPEIPSNLKLFMTDWTSYPLGEKVTVTGVELSRDNVETIYDNLVLDENRINICVLHGQESGYVVKGNKKAETIVVSKLANKGIDYLALGHIHTYRLEQLDARGLYCYSGCLEGRGFDECGDKGFVLLEIDENKDLVEPIFIPFARRKLFEFSVDVSECNSTAEVLDAVRGVIATKNQSRENMIKVTVTGRVPVEANVDMDIVSARLSEEYYFIKIKDETKPEVDYNAYKSEKTLKGEFFRHVMNSDLDEETKAEVIRFGIHALAGEVEV